MSTDVPKLEGPSRRAASGGPARQLVVLLHGWGADGNDLISLAQYLGAALPDADFVAPHGPEPCEAGIGRQWFGLMTRNPDEMRRGLEAVAPAVQAFIDAELSRRGLDGERLMLVGFSQGTMLALHVGPQREPPPAAIVGFSGALLSGDLADTTGRPPVILIHGTDDDIVPPDAMPHAEEALRAAGFPVEGYMRAGLGHGIDPEGITLAGRFLARNAVDN